MHMTITQPRAAESGNMIFFILLAIVLVGLVTAALRSGGIEGANIDREDMVIKVAQVRQNASELERAVALIIENGTSETDLSFAPNDASALIDYGTYNTNPTAEVFNPKGGGAIWRQPPSGVNDGSHWEFYGDTAAPGIGSQEADLIAVLPNVNATFCAEVNRINGQTNPADTATCLYPGVRFVPATRPFSSSPNTMDTTTFSNGRGSEACVICGANLHYYHVLMGR